MLGSAQAALDVSDEEARQRLVSHRTTIIGAIDAEAVIGHLVSIFPSHSDVYQQIQLCTTPRNSKNRILVEAVSRGGVRAFKALIAALYKTGFVELADLLAKNSYPNLKRKFTGGRQERNLHCSYIC